MAQQTEVFQGMRDDGTAYTGAVREKYQTEGEKGLGTGLENMLTRHLT